MADGKMSCLIICIRKGCVCYASISVFSTPSCYPFAFPAKPVCHSIPPLLWCLGCQLAPFVTIDYNFLSVDAVLFTVTVYHSCIIVSISMIISTKTSLFVTQQIYDHQNILNGNKIMSRYCVIISYQFQFKYFCVGAKIYAGPNLAESGPIQV